MLDDQQIAIPVNRTDDCHADQPPKDDAAAATCPIQPLKDDASCPIPPPTNETKMSDVGLLAEKDDASSCTPPQNYDAIFAPVPNTDDGRTLPPKEDASSAPPPLDDIAPPACLSPLPLDETVLIKANNVLENADRSKMPKHTKKYINNSFKNITMPHLVFFDKINSKRLIKF
ncbi:uncharacterized protein LOC111042465 [Myzus persicae]|uniref:uncharacterized protein LOC111042465 n=1 Tax=Myzus persicae TaxID=13164 RepID=UPI000B9378BA|nr:uncharacterized protein LOC111042465 [Myzus persicae]